ncbi:MAG: hypothetical protein V3T92_05675 [Anaerolineae bacterium]
MSSFRWQISQRLRGLLSFRRGFQSSLSATKSHFTGFLRINNNHVTPILDNEARMWLPGPSSKNPKGVENDEKEKEKENEKDRAYLVFGSCGGSALADK